MPISTPTIVLTATSSTGSVAIAVTNTGTGNDHNAIWRQEGSNAAVCISNTLTVNGTYTDYNIRSGITYQYYAEAFDASGFSLTSTISAASVTLSYLFIHQVTKAAATNKTGTAVTLLNEIGGQTINLTRTERVNHFAAQAAPDVDLGLINYRDIRAKVLSRFADRTQLATLKSLFDAKQTYFVRDQLGTGYFASLPTLPVGYDFNDAVDFQAWETDYNESVI